MHRASLQRAALITASIALSLLAVSCNNSTNPPAQQPITGGTPIGPNGGTVVSSDNSLTLTIPAGALSQTQNIAVQTMTSNSCPEGFGMTYSLLPEGLTFSKPVTLTIHYLDTSLANSNAKFIGVAYHASDGKWYGVTGGSVDTIHKTVSVPINHFSDWSEYESYSISPTKVTVTTGGTANFTVTETGAPADDPSSPLVSLVPTPVVANEWDVNGIADGNSSVGTIMNLISASYQAPASMPSPDPVTIQAKIVRNDGSVVWLYASVFVLTKDWELQAISTSEFYWPGEKTLECTDTCEDDWTFHLDDHGNVTSAEPVTVTPLPVVHTGISTSVAGCNSSNGVSGTPIRITKITGGYDGLNIDLSVECIDAGAPGWTVTCPVAPGYPPETYTLPPDNSEISFDKSRTFSPFNPAPFVVDDKTAGGENCETWTLIPK